MPWIASIVIFPLARRHTNKEIKYFTKGEDIKPVIFTASMYGIRYLKEIFIVCEVKYPYNILRICLSETIYRVAQLSNPVTFQARIMVNRKTPIIKSHNFRSRNIVHLGHRLRHDSDTLPLGHFQQHVTYISFCTLYAILLRKPIEMLIVVNSLPSSPDAIEIHWSTLQNVAV